jgi:hypothetical protein
MATKALFRVQLVVSGVGMALGVGMLIAGRDAAVYLPLVTSIIGYWLPAPQHPGDDPPPAAQASAASVGNVAACPATVEHSPRAAPSAPAASMVGSTEAKP